MIFMLVKIEGQKGEERLVVSSRQVAEDFEREHRNVLASIRDLLAAEISAAKFFYESSYENRGKRYTEYLMNRDGFSLLVMGFSGEQALKWKIKYIQAFNAMEEELKRIAEERKKWEIERAKGILTRHILTETIKTMIAESPHKKFAYSNYTKLIYKVLFNATTKELNEKYGVKARESLRDYLNEEQLEDVKNLEHLTASLISIGWGYEQIKTFLIENVAKKLTEEEKSPATIQ